ncbi:sterol desaturase family protein [Novosphingobium profundi]|uniref:sterol desaturase family protein n=1 Tax=Novosphingobium profundi TaxID=1774954 RepID=UPI001BD9E9CB|nr:sterol desaturase family protein [Novosphingobium profundi]MBT0667580.1 sterol desaturase family protein [Novosphingobium profundi]
MDHLPACDTDLSRSEPAPLAGDTRSPAAALVDLLPVATLAAVVLFWMLAPESWTQAPWSLVIAGAATTAFIQLLELRFERHRDWRMNAREFATDLFYVVLSYTAISWVTNTLAEEPLLALKASMGLSTPWALHLPFLAQVALVIFLIEFGQYWMHRLMHNVHPFWLTHAPHHHITQLNAAKGYVGNPVELFLISLSVVSLFDLSTPAVFCAINALGVISGFAHANVRSNPPLFYSFFFTTIRHHSLHHSTDYKSTRCNYANSLIVLDRIFGTFREGEASVVGQDERKRLSIKEQFLFPVQPLIDRLHANQTDRGTPAR